MNSLRQKWDGFLLKLGATFKIDARYAFSGGFWMTVEQAFAALSSFLLALAFAHFLSKEAYGNYKFVFSIISVLSALMLSGLSTVIIQAAARNQDGFLKKAFLLNLKWSSFFTLAMIVVGGYYYWNNNHLLAISMTIAALFAPLFASANFYDPFLIGKKAFRADAFLNGLSLLVPAVLIILTMTRTQNYALLVLVYYLSNTLANLIIYGYVHHTYRKNEEIDGSSIGYSKHLSLMNVFSAIASNIDQILIFHFLGAASLAIFAFATAMPEMIKGLVKNLGNLVMPRFSEKTVSEINVGMEKKIWIFLGGVGVAIVLYIIAAPYIFRFLFPQYLESLPFSQIYAFSLLGMASIIPTAALQAHSAQKELYKITGYTSLIQIAVIGIMLFYFGLWGIIFARILNRLLNFFISQFYWMRFSRKLAVTLPK